MTVAQIATVLGMIYQCGSGLACDGGVSAALSVAEPPLSQASQLPQVKPRCLDGKGDAEGIAAVLTAHKHITAVHQRNRLDDGQTQPVVCSAVAA